MVYAVRGSRGEGAGLVVMGTICVDILVEARVERQEQIVMGTSGTMLDWVMKKKVLSLSLSLPPSPHWHVLSCVYRWLILRR